MWTWVKRNNNLITAVFWAGMVVPVLIFRSWQESILLLLLNAIYTTFKTDISAHFAQKASREVSNGPD